MVRNISRVSVIPLVLFLSLGMNACSEKKNTGSDIKEGLSFPAPMRFSAAASNINTSSLVIRVELATNDFENPKLPTFHDMKFDKNGDGTIRGEVKNIPAGSYDMRMHYYLYDGPIEIEVVTTDFQPITVSAISATPITFTEAMNNYPDQDGDGASNLHELDKSTDWDDVGIYPPPDDPYLTVLIQDLNVNLSWKNVGTNSADPTTYTVYVADVPITKDNFTKVATAYPNERTPFTSPKPLTKNGPYYFRVRAKNLKGDGDFSAPVSVNPRALIPNDFTIVSNNETATFSWSNTGLQASSRINLFMQNSPGVKKLGSARLDGWMAHFNIDNGFIHTRLKQPNHPYYFALASRNIKSENSAVTSEVVIQPAPVIGKSPTGVGLHFTADGNVFLVWDKVDGRDYAIYHATTASVLSKFDAGRSGEFSPLTDGIGASLPFDLKANNISTTTENYFVMTSIATNGNVESADSSIVGFVPQGTLSAPLNLVAELVDVSAANIGTAELSWTPVVGATSYNLYMGPDPSIDVNNFIEAGLSMVHRELPTANFSHSGIASKTKTYFRVTAVNAFLESLPSPEKFTIERLPVAIPVAGTSYLSTVTAIDKLNVNVVVTQVNNDPSVQVTDLTLANGDPLPDPILEGTSVNLQVTLPPDGDQFLKAGNGSGSAAGALAYYDAVDPLSRRDTFFKWKEINGISFVDPAIGSDVQYEVPDAQVMFFNGKDHNLARVVSMKRSGGNIAFYADHFDNLEDAASIDSANFTNRLKETVAIEFTFPATTPAKKRDNVRYLKFFAFDANGNRVDKINLDGRGDRFLPEACVVCHAGDAKTFLDNPPTGKPNPPVYPKQGNVNARFNPFDVEAFKFLESSPVFNQTIQETQFRLMNEAIVEAYGVSKQKKVVYDSVLAGVAGTTINDYCDLANVTGAAGCADQTNGNTKQAATVIFQEGVVDKISVSIDLIEHPDLTDLLVNLISPAGTVVPLGRISASSGVVFDIVSSTRLEELYGEDSVGRWQLQILDTVSTPIPAIAPVLKAWTLNLTLKPPAVELIEGWYGGVGLPSTIQNGTFVPRGWRTITSVKKYNAGLAIGEDGPIELYRKVIKKSCRVCHLQRGSSGSILDFATWDNFNKDAGNLEKNQRWLNRIEHEVYVEGNMPRALPTFTGFWLSEQPQILAKFLRPGSATQVPASPAPISGLKGPGNPFLHSGRIHNVPDDGATLGGSANAPVRLGSAVEHYTQDEAGNFIGAYNWWLASKPAASNLPLNTTIANSQYPMLTPDAPGEYILKGTVTIDTITSNISEDRVYVHTDMVVKNPLSFSDIVKDILKPDCGRCHRSGGPADHTGYLVDRNMFSSDNDGDDATAGIPGIYDLIVNRDRRIDPRTAKNSRLLQKPSMFDDTTHGGRVRPGFDKQLKAKPPGTSESYEKILQWIKLRPLNGVPPPD